MLKWFRPGTSPHQTALAMIGAKAGDIVLMAGNTDPALAAEVARVTGLNGQTTIVAEEKARAAFETAAGKVGSLVDLAEPSSADPGTVPTLAIPMDIVVVTASFAAVTADAASKLAASAILAVRPGGRLIAIDTPKHGAGLLGGLRGPEAPAFDLVAVLTSAGAIAARRLAAEAGVSYYEARRAR